jgi:hypothetical protein
MSVAKTDRIKKRPTGKWTEYGVPQRGWSCVSVYDVEEPTHVCEMCEVQLVRFVHVMRHPDYPEGLDVGCVCAGHMEGDYRGARLREQQFKQRVTRRARWLSRKWRTSRKGNEYLNADGFNVVVFRYGRHWTARVARRDAKFERPVRRLCESADAAKLAAFDFMAEVNCESDRGFDTFIYRESDGCWSAVIEYDEDYRTLYASKVSRHHGSYETVELAKRAALDAVARLRRKLPSSDWRR